MTRRVPRAPAPVSYRLAREAGRSVILSSAGERIPWSCFGVSSEHALAGWQAKQEVFLRAGVRLFQLAVWPRPGAYFANPFWSPDGRPVREPRGPMTLGQQAEWLLGRAPDARFLVRFGIHPDPAWRAVHPAEYAPLEAVSALADGRSVMPSLASARWRAGVTRLVRDVVAWCERQPWRDRIVGYSVFPYGEGTTEVGYHGELFDGSPVMRRAFQAFVRGRYATDRALRNAWGEPAAQRACPEPPTRAGWREKRARLKLMHWPDPARTGRERDYFALQRLLFRRFWTAVFEAMRQATRARPVIKAYDIFKQPMLGWLHDPGFVGDWAPDTLDDYGCALLASGSLGVADLLDHPGLDALQTPGAYEARAMGFAWEAEGLSDSLALRGKVNWMEADMRTWVNRDWAGHPRADRQEDAGLFRTPAEMRAGFDRTLAWALSRNQMFYFMSVCGANWWYDDPAIGRVIARQTRVVRASCARPWRETTDAICVVLDDESPLAEDFSAGFQHLAVRRQIEEGLALCGLPYRLHLLADLARRDFPRYRCFLFPNLFKVDGGVVRLLRRTVLRDGNVAIFGPGTGVTDGRRLTPAGASALLGMRMELLPKSTARRVLIGAGGHPVARRVGARVFGDSHAFGPLLVPAQPPGAAADYTELGSAFFCYFLDRPGLVVREAGRGARGARAVARGAGDYAVVFSAALPLPPELLRECARHAGCHVWSEENAVVCACGGFAALHAAGGGRHELRLPGRTGRLVWNTKGPTTRLVHLD